MQLEQLGHANGESVVCVCSWPPSSLEKREEFAEGFSIFLSPPRDLSKLVFLRSLFPEAIFATTDPTSEYDSIFGVFDRYSRLKTVKL